MSVLDEAVRSVEALGRRQAQQLGDAYADAMVANPRRIVAVLFPLHGSWEFPHPRLSLQQLRDVARGMIAAGTWAPIGALTGAERALTRLIEKNGARDEDAARRVA